MREKELHFQQNSGEWFESLIRFSSVEDIQFVGNFTFDVNELLGRPSKNHHYHPTNRG